MKNVKKKLKWLASTIATTFIIISTVIYYEYIRYWKTERITIKKFDTEIVSTLKPVTYDDTKNKYNYHSIWITGYVNDTAIMYNNLGIHFIIDSINDNFFYDYYTGHEDAFMRFDPYKATEGKLKIIHKIR